MDFITNSYNDVLDFDDGISLLPKLTNCEVAVRTEILKQDGKRNPQEHKYTHKRCLSNTKCTKCNKLRVAIRSAILERALGSSLKPVKALFTGPSLHMMLQK